jgi:DNA-directed RNA polymerase beta subunit/intein/homing endonuclease
MPEPQALPRDGDGDGYIYDGKPHMRPVHSQQLDNQLSSSPPAPKYPEQPPGRRIDDADAIRQAVFDDSLAAVAALPPVVGRKYTLSLADLKYLGPSAVTIGARKQARLEGRTMARKLMGTWNLHDNATGEQIASRRATVAQIPYYMPTWTFLLGGNDYPMAYQSRLKSGVYARRKSSGELESHLNVLPGEGFAHRILLDPETGKFKLLLGQSKLPLAPLLKTLGVTDSAIRAAWGPVATQNLADSDSGATTKLHARLVRPGDTRPREQAIAEGLHAMRLDPEVTQRTLGKPYDRVSPDVWIDAAAKLLAINRGEAETDDRDSLAYMRAYGPEDTISERLLRATPVLRSLLYQAERTGTLAKVPPGALTKTALSGITESGLGQPGTNTNPFQLLDQAYRVTRMGVGGIPCYSADTEVFTSRGWKPWPEVVAEDELACLIAGRLAFRRPKALYAKRYTGPMLAGRTKRIDYLVTPHHRMYVASITTIGRKNTYKPWEFRTAEDLHGKHVRHRTAAKPILDGESPATFSINPAPVEGQNRGSAIATPVEVAFGDWLDFLACYLADGSYAYVPARRDYKIEIGKRLSKNPGEHAFIASTLSRLGFTHHYSQDRRFVLSGKHLAYYVSQFGHSADKFVPDYVLNASLADRKRFFDALTTMDNSGKTATRRVYASASRRLAEQVGQLAIGLGYSVTYATRRKVGESPQYQVVIRTAENAVVMLQKKRDQYRIEDYDGVVYCASVEGSLLFVRRNGKTFWCGNSVDSISAEARNVQPSQFGFVDPLITPESLRAGVDGRFAAGVRKGRDGRIYAQFRDLRTGRPAWMTPEQVAEETIVFPGEIASGSKHVTAMVRHKQQSIRRNQARYDLPSMRLAFSPSAGAVPLKPHSKGQRVTMGARMLTQALPLEGGEAPLVQAAHHDDPARGFEQMAGNQAGALRATGPGVVESTGPNKVVVRYAGGRRVEHELYNHYPLGRKTFLHQDAVVRPGQMVSQGDLLARSNFTDPSGALALGLNARVAYMPWHGHSFEDAIVVSQSLANRLTSQHAYRHAVDTVGGTKADRDHYSSIFPRKFTAAQLATIGDNGLAQPGTVVHYGDPLVLATKPRGVDHKSLHGGKKGSYTDAAEIWEHHVPGTVVDAVNTKTGVAVIVKAAPPMQVGDKLCYDAETSMLTRKGWKLVGDITLDDEIATLNPKTDELEYQHPTHVHRYDHDGPMYRLCTRQISMLVTPEHNLWVARPGKAYGPMRAVDFYKAKGEWQFKKDCKWVGVERNWMEFAPFARRDSRMQYLERVAMDDWLEFLGYYLAEGRSCVTTSGGHQVQISQFRSSDAWQKIHDVLTRIGVRFTYNERSSNRFEINSQWLYGILKPLGDSYSKYVPAYVQELSPRQLRIFLDAYLAGDGSTSEDATWEYGSSSQQLAEDVQVICLKLGWAVNVKRSDRKDNWQKKPHWKGRVNKHHLRPWWKKSRAVGYDSNFEGMVPYVGEVFCVTVPNHVVYVKRDDKTHWSMNSGRVGDKGVVGAIIPDEQMPIGADGKPYEVLMNSLGVISRCYDEVTEFLTEHGWMFGRDVRDDDKLVCFHPWTEGLFVMPQLLPFHRQRYVGEMLVHKNKTVDFCVTPNHRMWARCAYPGSLWQDVTAERIFGRHWNVPVAGNPVPGVETPFSLPVDRRSKKDSTDQSDVVIDAGDWAEFLGWYVAEGNVDTKVHVSQSDTANPEKCAKIAALLSRLPFKWKYNAKNTQFHVNSIRLVRYLKQFGLCDGKFIPDWLFTQPYEIRQRFLDAYWAGDGSHCVTAAGRLISAAGTRSLRLADDLQRLWVYQGVSSSVRPVKVKNPDNPMWRCGRHFRKTRILEPEGWSKSDYNGMVYCPTVPTGYVVTRRNGTILIAGNSNPSQLIESALGKVAALTGRPYVIRDFDNPDLAQFAADELNRYGLTHREDLIDPSTGRTIPQVTTGTRFVMKLEHVAEGKAQGRGLASYTAEGTPGRGGATGSKKLALLDLNALLSHGATHFVRGSGAVRGQQHADFWEQYVSGHAPPEPKVPAIYRKFVASLQASGINPIRTGTRTQLTAMTDRDVDKLAENRELQNAETVDWTNGMRPVPGGLFDPGLTGGHDGNQFAKITLAEPMPSPVMSEPIRRLLNLTDAKYRAILAGSEPYNGQTGPGAIGDALDKIDISRELARARNDIASGKATARDAAIRRLKHLKSAEATGIHPRDWMVSKVPVLPPAFRPVSLMQGSKVPLVADANALYRSLFDANENFKAMSGRTADMADERDALYRSLEAVVGLGDPIHPKDRERGVRGLLKQIFGDGSPKYSFVQRKLLGASTDLVGRAVIIPDPTLDMDHIGLPEDQAWEIYRPFVVRRLIRAGMPKFDAVRGVVDRSPGARKALVEEMNHRPVIVNRAPVLHRYGIMAFRPHLAKGSSLRVSPIIDKGMGADHDGDAEQFHLPFDESEIRDALDKMLPSRNLIAPSSFKVHMLPSNEFAGGLYQASTSKPKDGPVQRFATRREAIAAWRSGRLKLDEPIEIDET